MSVRTKERPTETENKLVVSVIGSGRPMTYRLPRVKAPQLRRFFASLGAEPEQIIPSEGASNAGDFTKKLFERTSKPGVMLRGLRAREGISLRELAERTGVDENNLSNMELGRRPIGRVMAKRLAKQLGTDYRLFL